MESQLSNSPESTLYQTTYHHATSTVYAYQRTGKMLMHSLLIRLTLTLLLLTSCAIAQQSGEDTWTRYRPGKLSSTIQAHSTHDGSSDNGMDLGSDAVRARVTYTGKSRPTSGTKRRFIAFYMASVGAPEFSEKFTTEMLFIEDGVQFWLPVQDVLIPHLRRELKKGESTILFTNWIGVTYPEQVGSGIHVFLVNEFEKLDVAKAAQSAIEQWKSLTSPDRDFTVDFPAEPKRDEFRGESSIGKAGPLIRRYVVFIDVMMLVVNFQDLGYAPNNPFIDSVAPAYEQKVKESGARLGWKIVGIRRLSRSAVETEAWERSKSPDGYVHSISRTIVRNGQAYDLQCRSMFLNQEIDVRICNRFLNSFHVIGPPQ
jgi:hypothetical protein